MKQKIKIKPVRARPQPIRARQPRLKRNDFWGVFNEAGNNLDLMGRDSLNLV